MDGLENIGAMDMIVVGVRALISGFHSKDVPHESCWIDVEGWEKATILQIKSDHHNHYCRKQKTSTEKLAWMFTCGR